MLPGGGETPGHGSGQVSLSVPRLQPVLRGRHSTGARLLFLGHGAGAVPPTPGQARAAGHGEMGQPCAEPRPPQTRYFTLQAAATLPRASLCGMAATRAARSSAHKRPPPRSSCPAQASRPSALPRRHTGSKWGFIASCFATEAGMGPSRGSSRLCTPSPGRTGLSWGGRGGCSSAGSQLSPLTVNAAFFYAQYHNVVFSQEGSRAKARS